MERRKSASLSLNPISASAARAKHLEKNRFLMGDTFTVADAYLFTILRWAPGIVDLSAWPVLKTYMNRIETRPAVYETLLGEGLVESKLAA